MGKDVACKKLAIPFLLVQIPGETTILCSSEDSASLLCWGMAWHDVF
jgi:hypothetical protein